MRTKLSQLAALLLAGMASALIVAPPARAAVPQSINFQGRLVLNGKPANGTQTITFTMFDALSGGNQLWTETDNVTTKSGGTFSVLLGALNPISPPIFGISTVFLEMQVNGTILSPRTQLVTSPYAFHAWNSDLLQGKDFSLVFTNPTAGTALTTTGSVGIGTASPINPLSVAGNANVTGTLTTGALAGDGSKVTNLTATNLNGIVPILNGGTGASTAPGALANLGALPLAGGTMTGTLNSTAGTALTTTGSVGIGTASPINPLSVAGNANVTGTLTAGALAGDGSKVTNLTATNLSGIVPILNGGTGASTASGALTNLGALPLAGGTMTGTLNSTASTALTTTGKVGIGTTNPTNPLSVVGNANVTGALSASSLLGSGAGVTNLQWSSLSNFPVGCPPGQFVTSVGGSLQCAAPSAPSASGSQGIYLCPNKNSTVYGPFLSTCNGQISFAATCCTGCYPGGGGVCDPVNGANNCYAYGGSTACRLMGHLTP